MWWATTPSRPFKRDMGSFTQTSDMAMEQYKKSFLKKHPEVKTVTFIWEGAEAVDELLLNLDTQLQQDFNALHMAMIQKNCSRTELTQLQQDMQEIRLKVAVKRQVEERVEVKVEMPVEQAKQYLTPLKLDLEVQDADIEKVQELRLVKGVVMWTDITPPPTPAEEEPTSD